MDTIAVKEQEFTSAAKIAIQQAHGLEIANEDDLRIAAGLMDGFKKAKQSVAAFFKPMKDNAYKAHKEICAREKELLNPYDEADKAVRVKVTVYNAEQQRIAAEKEAELKARQEAEAKALMEQAIKAENDGNIAVAESLLKQASITETISTPVQQAKIEGLSFRATYTVEIEDISKVPTEINGVLIRPVDESAIKKLAQMSKGNIKIPGIKIVTTQQAVSR